MKDRTFVKVSVIITTYNQKDYIRESILSVLSQETKLTYELLVGDDCSTDGTADIVRELAELYPDIIFSVFNKENLGASANFYHLLQCARGFYIALLEGDDIWSDPQKLDRQVQYLESNRGMAACVHDVILIDKAGNSLPIQKLEWVKPRICYSLKDYDGQHLPGHISSLMFRNFLFQSSSDYSIITSHKQISDRCIFLVLLAKGKIGRLPGAMGKYRILRGQEEENITNKLFLLGTGALWEEMCLLSQMEAWLKCNYGIRKPFLKAKSGIMAAALFGRNRSRYRSLSRIWPLMKCSGYPMRLLLYLPGSVVRRFWVRFVGQVR